jgi:hypothetical protein
MDNDADLDLVVANSAAGSVSVFINDAGAFSARSDYLVGAGPRSLAAGDLHGDGSLDLAVAAGGAGTVWVLRNDGQAGFALSVDFAVPPIDVPASSAQPTSYRVRSSPHTLVIADLDGVGQPEIAVAHFAAGVSVHFQGVSGAPGGSDVFAAPSVGQPAGPATTALVSRGAAQPLDVNGDGYVSPIDALLLINELNRDGAGETGLSSNADVSGDLVLSPLDALLVINHLNQQARKLLDSLLDSVLITDDPTDTLSPWQIDDHGSR